MCSPQSPPDEKGQEERDLPNSSALIKSVGRCFRYSAYANREPFPVLASLFLESFSYRGVLGGAVSSHVYTGSGGRYAVYTVIGL